jgi:hypothetical protein
LTEDQRIGFLHVVVQHCNPFDVCNNLPFKDHLQKCFSRRWQIGIQHRRMGYRHRNINSSFIEDGGPDVTSMLVFGASVLLDLFQSSYKIVGLFIIAAVKDVALQVVRVSFKLHGNNFIMLLRSGLLTAIACFLSTTRC